MTRPKYVASCSGGKDSVATLLLAAQHNEPLDEAVFSEVMFDQDTSGEVPEHRDFIYDQLKPFCEKELGIKFTILHADKTYDEVFHHIITRGPHKGEVRGFAWAGMCAVNRDCKIPPVRKYNTALSPDTVSYVGIAEDEPKRLARLDGITKVSLLAKYGMTEEQMIDSYKKLMQKGAKQFGIHAFLASNTISDAYYPELAGILFQLAVRVQQATGAHISYINLSGGVGIPYRPEQTENDIMAIGEGVRKKFEEILVPAGMGDVAIFSEMGRFTTGPYGALVSTVIHEKHIYKEYIGLDACAANLMRPAMYGAYHHITVLGKEDAPHDHKYDVVGGLCENNDKFAIDRMLPKIDIGDIVYIHDTGAHGSAMGYNYNGKLRSAEVLLCEDGSHRLIRRAETPRDYFATLDFLPFMKPLLGEYNDD